MISFINTGTSPNAGNGDSLRLAFNKVNNNFRSIVDVLGTSTSTISQLVSDKITQSFIHNNHSGMVAVQNGQQVVLSINTTVNQLNIGDAVITNELRVSANSLYVGNNMLTVNTSTLTLNGFDIKSFDQNLNTTDSVLFNTIDINSNIVSIGDHTLTVNTSTLELNNTIIKGFDQDLNSTDQVTFESLQVSTGSVVIGNNILVANTSTLELNSTIIKGFDQDLNSTSSVIFNSITPTDETGNLGHPLAPWNNIYVGTGTIFLNSGTIQMTGSGQLLLNQTDIVNTSSLQIVDTVPVSSTSTGVTGQMAVTTTSLYMCVGTDTWLKFDGVVF